MYARRYEPLLLALCTLSEVRGSGCIPPVSYCSFHLPHCRKSRNSAGGDFFPFFTSHTQIVCNLNANTNILFSTSSAFSQGIYKQKPPSYTDPIYLCVPAPIFRLQPINPSIHTSAVFQCLQRAARNPRASCQIILRWQINNATINFI